MAGIPQRTPDVTHNSGPNLTPARLRGFTLVELLVVIVIILILTSIVTPFIGIAMERANQSKCRTGLKKLHTDAGSYASQNRNRLPILHEAMQRGAIGKILLSGGQFAEEYMGQSWKAAAAPYYVDMLKDDNVFQFPSALGNSDHFAKRFSTNYRLTGFGLDTGGGEGLHPLTTVIGGTVQSKSGVHPAGEVAMALDWIWSRSSTDLGSEFKSGKSSANHADGANVLYGSGAARWVGLGSMISVPEASGVPSVDGLIVPPGTYGFIDGGTTGTYISAPDGQIVAPSAGKGNRKPGAGVMW